MTIIHPTDFSEEAGQAEEHATRLAGALGADVLLLHVSTETPLYGEMAFGTPDVKRIYEAQARWAEERLAARAEILTAGGVRARWLRRTGIVHDAICDVAREEAVDRRVVEHSVGEGLRKRRERLHPGV